MIRKIKAIIRVLVILTCIIVGSVVIYNFIKDNWKEILILAGSITVFAIIAWAFDY